MRPDKREQHALELVEAKSELLKRRAQLRRTEEERDILKKAAQREAWQARSLGRVGPSKQTEAE